ncbi:MAG: GNAT family N-acetyltransferase [Planctomycetota bacterium]|jgi:ribosomal protein S18 acetylase RimI-like enzyme
MKYRKLNSDDAEIWKQIRIRMLTDHPESFGEDLNDFIAKADEVSKDRVKDEGIVGAFDNDKLVGVVGRYRPIEKTKHKHIATIWGMYVSPAVRRQGVGRELIKLALENLKTEGVEIVYIGVESENDAAHNLYKDMGFKAWGTEPDSLRVNGKDYSTIHMYQRI